MYRTFTKIKLKKSLVVLRVFFVPGNSVVCVRSLSARIYIVLVECLHSRRQITRGFILVREKEKSRRTHIINDFFYLLSINLINNFVFIVILFYFINFVCIGVLFLLLFCIFFVYNVLERLTHDDGDRQELLVHPAVEVQGLHHHLVGVFEARVCRVPLLPQELPRPQERGGVLELPPGETDKTRQDRQGNKTGQAAKTREKNGIRKVHARSSCLPLVLVPCTLWCCGGYFFGKATDALRAFVQLLQPLSLAKLEHGPPCLPCGYSFGSPADSLQICSCCSLFLSLVGKAADAIRMCS